MHWICKWCLKTMLRKETSLRSDINFFTRLWDIVCNYFPILRAFIGYVHLFRIYFSKYVMYCAGIPSPIWVFADFRQFVWAFVHTRDEPWCWGKIISYENCWSKKLSLFSFSHFQYVSPGVYEAICKMSLDYHLTMWHSLISCNFVFQGPSL